MTASDRQVGARRRPARGSGPAVVDLTVPGGESTGPAGDSRRVVTPDGRTVVIRPLAADDVTGLRALYRRLPPAEWVSHLGVCDGHDRGYARRAATVGHRGGRGIVAQVSPEAEVVGEAHYELIRRAEDASGRVGEMFLILDPEWRDRLGRRLFDALCDDAAAHGVVDLEVTVMRSDTWLRTLLDRRAHVVLPTDDDWLSARVVVAADGGTPVWSAAPGRRVLVVSPDGRWHATAAARSAAMDVMICAGPSGSTSHCPMDEGLPCPLVAGADVVIVSYPPDRPAWDDWLALVRRLHPDMPVCVEGRAGRRVPEGIVVLDVHDPDLVIRRAAGLTPR